MKLTQDIINSLPKNFFKGMDLSYGNFEGLQLYRFDFFGCNLKGVNLLDVNLYAANFEGSDLRNADLRGANLWGANLNNADLEGANLKGTILTYANLWYCKINKNTQGISKELIRKFRIKVEE